MSRKKTAIIIVLSLMAGALWHEQRLPPFPQIKMLRTYLKGDFIAHVPPEEWRKVFAVRYEANIPVFSNRYYYDTVQDSRLNGLYVVQIPRHYHEDIVLEAKQPLTVYRAISMDNEDNLEGWEKTSIKVNIMGRSTIHTEVYAKEFQPGTIILKSGGPVSASPIFIKPAGNTMADESFSIPPQ